jgi:hypothetical protein
MCSERAVNYISVYTQRLTESEGCTHCCGYLSCHPPKMHCPPSSISFEGEAVQVTVSWRVFTQLFSWLLAHSAATYPLCIQQAGNIPTPHRTISLCNFSAVWLNDTWSFLFHFSPGLNRHNLTTHLKRKLLISVPVRRKIFLKISLGFSLTVTG